MGELNVFEREVAVSGVDGLEEGHFRVDDQVQVLGPLSADDHHGS
jgi:hypothetical protein